MKRIEKIFGIGMFLFAIGFNLWLYRLEPTAKLDPNDNTFQFALVDRTNQIWNFAYKKCSSNYLTFGICHLSFLMDHWVPNWAEGYNLPFYYSHLPQIAIVASYRFLQLFSLPLTLYAYYHLIIYLLLSFFPLSLFLALRVIKLPWLIAGIGALLASHLSTDGLYGLDQSSFLWRGYGLSSQLFAMIFLPLAIAYSIKYFMQNSKFEARNSKQYQNKEISKKSKRFGFGILNLGFVSPACRRGRDFDIRISDLLPAVFFLFATTAGHLGIGIIAILSLIPLAFGPIVLSFLNNPSHNATWLHGYIVKKQHDIHQQCSNVAIQQLLRFLILTGTTLFFLSYWIVPIVLNNNYHNISFWDPIWKFDSYGWKETLIRLFNGDLFDFGRLPILTVLVFLGFFASLVHKKRDMYTVLRITENSDNNTTLPIIHNTYPYSPLAFLFPFWLLLYFGRTTWGGLIDLIPGMKEFHLSRFLVGIHITGLFLAPLGIEAIVVCIMDYVLRVKEKTKISIIHNTYPIIHLLITCVLLIIMLPPIYRQTIQYNELNNTLIKQANQNYDKVKADVDELFRTLEPLKYNGRVFAGRGGGWGKDFRVAETPFYMHLSTYGINTVLWLPETWSLNSDTEQYFSEDQIKDYELYNIRYVVAPASQKPQPFWSLMKETATWKLYEVNPNNVTIQQFNNVSLGYFTAGIRPAIVSTDKESFINVVRLWIQSDYPTRGLYPELTFDKNYPKNAGLPNFRMIDEANYLVPDLPAGRQVARLHSLFAEPPLYTMPNVKCQMTNELKTMQQCNNVTIEKEENDSDMIFTAKISVPKDCMECIVVLKETSHPNWQVTIDGKRAERLDVFPFYNAVKISEGLPAQAGTHEVVFSYKPSSLKLYLIALELVVILWIIVRIIQKKKVLR